MHFGDEIDLPRVRAVSLTHGAARAGRWEESGYFKPAGDGEPFVIAMPPPNVTGALHMGHAMFVTLQDIMVRWARMNGKQALWIPGACERASVECRRTARIACVQPADNAPLPQGRTMPALRRSLWLSG
jgi:hypothetical protein